MEKPYRMARAQGAYDRLVEAEKDMDKVTDELMKRFI